LGGGCGERGGARNGYHGLGRGGGELGRTRKLGGARMTRRRRRRKEKKNEVDDY